MPLRPNHHATPMTTEIEDRVALRNQLFRQLPLEGTRPSSWTNQSFLGLDWFATWGLDRHPKIPKHPVTLCLQSEVGRQIDQHFTAWSNPKPPPGIGAVECAATVSRTQVDSVFALKAAHGHHETWVRNVWTIRGDFIRRRRTALRSCVGKSQRRWHDQKTAANL